MRLIVSAFVLIVISIVAASALAAEPLVVDLWPGKTPADAGIKGQETSVIRQSPLAGPTKVITNVSKPTLVVYRSSWEKNTGTAMIICPGGGYWDLYWELEGEEVAAWLNSIGMTGIILKYRCPRRPGDVVGEPPLGPQLDAQRAVSYVRSHAAEWRFDPKRIGMVGFSAGGHLALATATNFAKRLYEPIDAIDQVSCRPDFAVACYSGYLKPKDKDGIRADLHIPPDAPPIFLAHSSDDTEGYGGSNAEHSAFMYVALKRAGILTELHIYATGDHGFGVRQNEKLPSSWTGLCVKWLRSRGLLVSPSSPPRATADPPQAPTSRAFLQREAKALEPLVTSQLARDFLRATFELPAMVPRKLFIDEVTKAYVTETVAAALTTDERRKLKPVPVDESFYFTTKYGSPLAYARPLDLVARSGLEDASGRKILDFGYGAVGHLRLLAELGAEVVGVDVDPLLRALYSEPMDQGVIKNRRGRDGRLRLIGGRFPADKAVTLSVGTDYDLIISKNTLKRGYVHPERPVEAHRLLGLGVDDSRFVKALYDALKPGGRVMIYNICPAPSPPGAPYKNWADGRCPFAEELWKSTGFRVIAFDRDDSKEIRTVAHVLGWDKGESPIDLKTDLFAHYSLMEKTAHP
jgi:acetyl esterase/lipase/SAM-dependent methyltransferase